MSLPPTASTDKRQYRNSVWPSTGLRTRLVFAIVLVTVTVSLIGFYLNVDLDLGHLRRVVTEKNIARLNALKFDLVNVISDYNPESAVDLVERLESFPDVMNVTLYNNDLEAVFRYDRNLSDPLLLPDFVDILNSSSIVFNKGSVLIHRVVTYQGMRYGWVTVRVDTAEMLDLFKQYILTAILIFVGIACIALVLALLIGHYISKPIRRLAALTRRISQTGDFGAISNGPESGEIGDLYNGINAMLAEIESSAREIERLNETRVHNIINSSLDGVISVNGEGRISYWGRQSERIFGWNAKEVLGRELAEIIIPERYREQHEQGIKRFLDSGSPQLVNQRIELIGLHRDGHELPIEISLAAIKEQDGWTFNAFVRDLSGLKKAEQELNIAQAQLLRNERLAAVGQVTATVAHELRNPMGTISNSVYVLRNKLGESDPETVNIIDRVNRNVARCNTIINGLLDFSSVPNLILEKTAIDTWLESLLDEYESEWPTAIEIVRKLTCSCEVSFDHEHLQSAVTNLLDNAMHALMDDGSIRGGRIEVRTKVCNNRVGVVISDNGPGIPLEDREMVFEPLYSTRNFGVGLGLPAVAKIMKEHGGEVLLEEHTGIGVQVTLWLPAEGTEPAGCATPYDGVEASTLVG